jgi:hypothetical protein
MSLHAFAPDLRIKGVLMPLTPYLEEAGIVRDMLPNPRRRDP